MVEVSANNTETIARQLERDLDPTLQAAAVALVELIRDDLTPYPPAGPANRPRVVTSRSGGRTRKQIRWYERGYGTRWARKDGSVGGRKTSENLLRSWSTQPYGSTGARLTSAASYSGALHRSTAGSGSPKQTRRAAARGWKADRASVARVLKSGALEALGLKLVKVIES